MDAMQTKESWSGVINALITAEEHLVVYANLKL